MKKTTLFIWLLFCIKIIYCQSNDAAVYASSITGEDLKKHLTIIAGADMEGRETGTSGQRWAAAYIENHFKEIGLVPPPTLSGYQQFYPLFKDSIVSSTLKINGKKFQPVRDFYLSVKSNDAEQVTADQLVFAGYGISEKNYDDYKGKNVQGKVVIMFFGEPVLDGKYIVSGTADYSSYTYPGISSKIKIAKEKGAAAVVIINQASSSIENYTVINSAADFLPDEPGANLNYIYLSHPGAKKMLHAWKPEQLIAKALQLQPLNAENISPINASFSLRYKKQRKQVNASNVIGILEGTDKKDEYVFLTAHYDHLGIVNGKIYYGADDDGSGTCAVLQMAAAFAKAKAAGYGPRRSIVFMTVSGEEKGLWGSEHYTNNPVLPLEKTSVDLNTDMIGRIDTERNKPDTANYVYVVGHDKISTELGTLNEAVNNKYTQLVIDYKFDDPSDPEQIFTRSDHYNFAVKGVPVLFFYDGMLKGDYHKPTDTVDKINWALYEKRTKLIFYTAWEIANRDKMIKRDLPVPESTR